MIGFISDDDLYNDEGEFMRKEAVAHHTSQLLRLLKLFRFMRIIRLIRLFKLRGLVNRVSLLEITYHIYSSKKFFLTISSLRS